MEQGRTPENALRFLGTARVLSIASGRARLALGAAGISSGIKLSSLT